MSPVLSAVEGAHATILSPDAERMPWATAGTMSAAGTAPNGDAAPANAEPATGPTPLRTPGETLLASRRGDGWTAERQRTFLAAIAEGGTVEGAAWLVGLTPQSAYALRNRAAGAAFRIGWQAALLLQRAKLVDTLTARAFDGVTTTFTRADGSTVEVHRHDNRLALALLTRLDRVADAEAPDRLGEAQAARLVAGEWDRYLDLVAGDAGAAQVGLFLALREGAAPAESPLTQLAGADLYARTGAGVPAEVDISDLDLAARADWSGEQWSRAEAAGLLSFTTPETPPQESQLPQHSDGDQDETAPDAPVWWDDIGEYWRTNFPPPDDFEGEEEGLFGDGGYERALTPAEAALVEAKAAAETVALRARFMPERDAWFAALGTAEGAAPAPDTPA